VTHRLEAANTLLSASNTTLKPAESDKKFENFSGPQPAFDAQVTINTNPRRHHSESADPAQVPSFASAHTSIVLLCVDPERCQHLCVST
jgi:hypothetical protein